ncbi:MAG: phytanoyl-CoA dioxygenase family protein [bacterium]|nr:phytanoyl-CoA dioxygenase family protein [bacterium]
MKQKPLFDRPLVLTSDQIKFYDENGFLVVEDVFANDECDRAVEAFDGHRRKIRDEDYKGIMNLDRADYWSHIYGPNERWVHTYVKQMLVKHPAVVIGLEILQRRNVGCVVNLQSMFLFKQAGSPYAKQVWNPHQDNAYPRARQGAYITANLVFSDQDKENGCMYIYPGSHREPLLTAEHVASFHEQPGKNPGHDVTKSLPDKYRAKKIDLPMKKGSVLFLDGHCVHGSYPNVSPNRNRPMLLIPYLTNGYRFNPGNTGKRKELPIR